MRMRISYRSVNFFPSGDFARKILDGESTGVTTTHGIQVRSDFAQKYPEIVVAYLRATLEGDRLIRENPKSIAEQYQKWTGIEAEVFYAFHGPEGIQTRDYTLKPEAIAALVNAAQTLKVLKKTAHNIDVSTFVDDRYIREAARQSGYDYEARLKNYDRRSVRRSRTSRDALSRNRKSRTDLGCRGTKSPPLQLDCSNFSGIRSTGEAGPKGASNLRPMTRRVD